MYRVTILVLICIITISVLSIPSPVYGDPALPSRLLSIGSQGVDVTSVQEALNQLGYSIKADGIYGLQTKNAVIDFQKKYAELPDDGVYGPKTGSFMMTALSQLQPSDNGQASSEENVNDNLNEDKALTYRAGTAGLAYTLPQKFINENYDRLAQMIEEYKIVKEFNTTLPVNIKENIKYDKYSISYDYLLVTTNSLNIRELPTAESKILKRVKHLDKVNVIQEVQGQYLPSYSSDRWYRVFWHENGEIRFGYVFSSLCELRSLRFDSMLKEINVIESLLQNHKVGYISNYKNINGYPLAYKGRDKDAYGYDRSQSAPGYIDAAQSDFRYFPDGIVVSILAEIDGYYKVSTPRFEGEYLVPKKYISFKNIPKQLKKVVVIDDSNQNEGVFEFTNNQWELISFNYATTGINNKYSFETPKGHFMAIEKKSYFLYLEDGTNRISGFAPYAVRFSGGGYIHGVPIDFKPEQNQYNTDPRNPNNHEEYLFTIGTTPRSHKCVRNYTSHAKFIYEWTEIGSTMVIVID